MKDLANVCIGLIQISVAPIFLVLDGLDEVDPRDGFDCNNPLRKLLEKFKCMANLKVCVSSRPEPLFASYFRYEMQLRLQDLNKADLREYAEKHVHSCDSLLKRETFSDFMPNDSDPHQTLVLVLVEKSEGVFLWLCLAVRHPFLIKI